MKTNHERYLSFKVLIVNILQTLGILPNIWYQCEIDLAKIRGTRMAEFFKAMDERNERGQNGQMRN